MQEERNYTVYEHVFPNGKRYIGITSLKPKDRWRDGKGYRRKKNKRYAQPAMAYATLKYDWNTEIEHNILAENLSKEEAEQMEAELIAKYKSNDIEFGYNIENGGRTNKMSEATKKKLSEINKGRKHTEETKIKIRETEKALNKKLTKEQKEAVSKAQSVQVLCIETNVVYPSMTIAEEKTGISQQNISAVCSGKRKTAGGYHWQRVA